MHLRGSGPWEVPATDLRLLLGKHGCCAQGWPVRVTAPARTNTTASLVTIKIINPLALRLPPNLRIRTNPYRRRACRCRRIPRRSSPPAQDPRGFHRRRRPCRGPPVLAWGMTPRKLAFHRWRNWIKPLTLLHPMGIRSTRAGLRPHSHPGRKVSLFRPTPVGRGRRQHTGWMACGHSRRPALRCGTQGAAEQGASLLLRLQLRRRRHLASKTRGRR